MEFDPRASDWRTIRLTFREAMDPQKWLAGGVAAALTLGSVWLLAVMDRSLGGLPSAARAVPMLVFWGASQFSLCVVARMTALRLAHGGLPGLGTALAFAGRHAYTLFLAPLPFLVLASLPLALVSILGLLGNIPFLGDVLLGLFAIPSVALSLVSIFLFIIWLATTLFVPAIVAVEGSDVLDAAGKAVHLAFSSTWPLLRSLFLNLFFCVPFAVFVDVCLLGAMWLGFRALGRPASLSFPWSGDAPLECLRQENWLAAAIEWIPALWNIYPVDSSSSLTGEFRDFLLSVAAVAVKAVAWGMPLSFLGIGTTLSYTMCRFRTDGKSPREIVEDADELIEGEGPSPAGEPKGG